MLKQLLAYMKGDICKSADGKHVYFALSDSVGADPSKANYKKPTKPFDKATECGLRLHLQNCGEKDARSSASLMNRRALSIFLKNILKKIKKS